MPSHSQEDGSMVGPAVLIVLDCRSVLVNGAWTDSLEGEMMRCKEFSGES